MSRVYQAASLYSSDVYPQFWEIRRWRLARLLGVDLTHAQARYGQTLERYLTSGASWLEVGCGRQVLPEWAMPVPKQATLVGRAKCLVGVDVDDAILRHPLLTHRVRSFGNDMPFRSGSFDLVTANMVVEHVENPETFLGEIHRVLKPGGRFIFHTTNFLNYMIRIAHFVPDAIKHRIVWKLERRTPEDIFPTWYRINTPPQIRSLAAASRFGIEELQVVGSSGMLAALGPVGWLELLALKAVNSFRQGHYASNIICVLKRD
jgi:ubiquinone/menaquinone biosynthesis C-methylase UbiE